MAIPQITQIIDKTTKLELYTSATDFVIVDKAAVKLHLENNLVWLYDNSDSSMVSDGGTTQQYRLDYTVITAPLTASATLLVTAILAMLNTGTTGGDATAANQVIEIARLTSILAKIIQSPATEAKQDTEIARLTSILAQADITTSALRDALRGTSNITNTNLFTVLSDIDAYIQGTYGAVNILSTRIQGSLVTTGMFSDAVLATLIVTTNTAIQTGNQHLLGPISYVYDGALWYSFYTSSSI